MGDTNVHHTLVNLQAQYYQPGLQFEAPPGVTLSQRHYPETKPEELHERIHDATIIVMGWIKLDAVALSEEVTPHLQFISVTAVGTDSVDLEACRRRGIRVSNCAGANVESVSSHAIALYLAARRKIVQMSTATASGYWAKRGLTISHEMVDRDNNKPLTFEEEVVGILGYGTVGKKIAQLSKALGMKVLVATQKNSGNFQHKDNSIERIPFEEVLKNSTVIFVAVPRLPSTMNLISTAEFQVMSPQTVLVNIARGGIVDEAALLRALKDRSIYGAATDVFANAEPATSETSVLLSEEAGGLNLTLSPHLAWYAEKTMNNYRRMSPENVRNFILGQPTNLVV